MRNFIALVLVLLCLLMFTFLLCDFETAVDATAIFVIIGLPVGTLIFVVNTIKHQRKS